MSIDDSRAGTDYSFEAVSFHLPAGGVLLTGSSSAPVRALLSASAIPGLVDPRPFEGPRPVAGNGFSDSWGICCSCFVAVMTISYIEPAVRIPHRRLCALPAPGNIVRPRFSSSARSYKTELDRDNGIFNANVANSLFSTFSL